MKQCPHCKIDLVPLNDSEVYALMVFNNNESKLGQAKQAMPVLPRICSECKHVDLELNGELLEA